MDWGLRSEERSWVPARDILDHSLIDDYNQQVRSAGSARGAPRGRGTVTVHGFPVPSSPCLVCMRVRMCEQVSVGVVMRLIRSS